jgi:hypothetical protein
MQLTPGDHAMTTRRANASHDKALDAFMTTKLQIDAMLERLKALSDVHFNSHPDEINWDHVGTLNHFFGCRPLCKKFLTLLTCDRVRSSFRPRKCGLSRSRGPRW